MPDIMARCGNRCHLCPLYKDNFSLATSETVNLALYKYHHNSQGPQPHYNLACDGCLSDGQVAREGCRIRECALRKAFATCAECDDLFCSLLEADMGIVEDALARHISTIPSEDYDSYFRPFLIRQVLSDLRSDRLADAGPAKA